MPQYIEERSIVVHHHVVVHYIMTRMQYSIADASEDANVAVLYIFTMHVHVLMWNSAQAKGGGHRTCF